MPGVQQRANFNDTSPGTKTFCEPAGRAQKDINKKPKFRYPLAPEEFCRTENHAHTQLITRNEEYYG